MDDATDPSLKEDLPYESYIATARALTGVRRRQFTTYEQGGGYVEPSLNQLEHYDPESILARDIRVRELRALHGLPLPPRRDPWGPQPDPFVIIREFKEKGLPTIQETLSAVATEIVKALDSLATLLMTPPPRRTLPARAYRKYRHAIHPRHHP